MPFAQPLFFQSIYQQIQRSFCYWIRLVRRRSVFPWITIFLEQVFGIDIIRIGPAFSEGLNDRMDHVHILVPAEREQSLLAGLDNSQPSIARFGLPSLLAGEIHQLFR